MPLTLTFRLFCMVKQDAAAILQVVFEAADVPVSIYLKLCTMSVHFSENELTLVSRAVREVHDSFALNVVVHKFSFVNFASVCEVVFSVAVELTLYKVAFVVASFELKSSDACLFTIIEHA